MTTTARQDAYLILLKIEKDKAYSNLALDSAVRASAHDSAERAFISRLVYGVTERKITLDYAFSRYLKKPASKLSPQALTILRLGTYQILFLDGVPSSAAVNESVKLAALYCKSSSGLINAVLRRVSENGLSFPGTLSPEERLSLELSVPTELVRFFNHHYGEENTRAFFENALEEKTVCARANTVKTTREVLLKELKAEGVLCEEGSLKESVIIKKSPVPIYETTAYKNGHFHIQDEASQLATLALDPKAGDRILDSCAAPGGKSFTIAEMCENRAEIYSCDIYEKRTRLIKDGAKRLSLNINAVVNDASVFRDDFGVFDKVLCDVPCSGLGIISKKPEIKYKKLDDIKELLPIQRKILEVNSRYVKPSGTLVYSTCSVNPSENRKICDAFLKEHPEFKSVKVLPSCPRLKDEGDYLTLMPHINNCDGFFIAKFVRD